MNNKTFVTLPVLGDQQKILEKISACLDSKTLTNNGPQVKLLKKALKKYLNVPNISLFCNGTIALLTALKALSIKGEVITTPFTFPATVHALEWMGLTPVFCDIEPDTMCIDAEKIEGLITEKTSAILGVHVYGMPCSVAKIEKIAGKHRLKVVYDAAHSFITKINKKHIGLYGDISMFSFHATKLFNTVEGGALICNDEKLTNKLSLLKNFGLHGAEVKLSGINGKMNEIQAIIGFENLKNLENEITKRKAIFELYNQELASIAGIELLKYPENINPSLQYYVIRIDEDRAATNRDEVYEELKKQNIFARKYFHPLCSNFPCYNHLKSAKKTLLPIANKTAREVLCLPFYGAIETSVVKTICKTIQSLAYKK